MAAITITAASITPASGATKKTGVAGATITAGQSLYADATDSDKLKLSDANASLAAAAFVGVSLHAALAGQPIAYIESGDLNMGVCLTKGSVYVVGATVAGDINPHGDLASGWYTSIIGIAISTSVLRLGINVSGITTT